MGEDTWEWSDAWFASAVPISWRSADLSHIIGGADARNHDIPTHRQVEQAARRLSGSGLLVIDEGPRFRLTRTGRRLLRHAHRHGLMEQPRAVLALLESVPLRTSHYRISADEVQRAYEAYRRRMR